MEKKIGSVIIIVLFSAVSTIPLLHNGLPPTHDGEYHIIRFYEFYKVLESGVLYPRWAPDLNSGHGAPLFNFVYPLPNYIAALFHLLGFSFIDAFKYNLLAATFIGALLFYFLVKHFFGYASGIVSAIVYTFSPYRLVDIYVRGSVGEVWSMAIAPGLLLALSILIKKNDVRFIPLTSVLIALMIFSHNILAVLFFPFFLSFSLLLIILKKEKRKSLFFVTVSFLFGIGIASIFWLPAILEKPFVTGLEVYDYASHFPDLTSLLFPSWGTGFAGEAGGNGMSTQIGVVNLIIIFASLFLLKRTVKRRSFISLFFLSWFFLATLLMLNVSRSIWASLPFFNYVQFPWRYLSVVVIVCAFLAGSVVASVKFRYFVALVFIILSVLTTISYTKPAYYHLRDDSYYTSRSNFIDGTNSPGNAFNTIYLRKKLKKEKLKAVVRLGEGKITTISVDPQSYQFYVYNTSASVVEVKAVFFPGWEALDNKRPIPVSRSSEGLIEIFLVPGEHFITVLFTDTIVRRVATVISCISILSLIVVGIFLRRNTHESRN